MCAVTAWGPEPSILNELVKAKLRVNLVSRIHSLKSPLNLEVLYRSNSNYSKLLQDVETGLVLISLFQLDFTRMTILI